VLLLLAVCWLASASRAVAQSADDVGAAFLYNFAKFVEWPAKSFPDAAAPITIGFVGKTPMADIFEQNVRGKTAAGREFLVKRLDGLAGAETCQMVFLTDASQAAALVGATKSKSILTVGLGDAFLSAGGMIAFSKDGARLVFDVNIDLVKAIELKPDPKLEKAARSVKHS